MIVAAIKADAEALIETDQRFADIDPAALPVEVWGAGFGPLIHLVLGQQVSVEAADAMYDNLLRATGDLTPQSLLRLDDPIMRSCGFTRMKADYARGIAHAALHGFAFDALDLLPDHEVVERLTELRGVGRWTAECYLLFCLGRRDVFPAGDLALRVGYQELAGLAAPPTEDVTATAAASWAPRRTAAAYLVWQGYLERRGRAGSVPYR